MKEFNVDKFCKDLVAFRGKQTQTEVAKRLGVKNRSTLSLLENGKQMPTIDILSKLCDLTHKNTDDYFIETNQDSLVFLMGSLEETDKKKVAEMIERIEIKEKYERLAKRSNYVLN